ncbi:MAG TPA: carboxypeptidase regulatory-like domain-containing protein [Pyrinomonadaceae bacterium]|nr:carboxypeptidase regulatory-like domain-containing protein [Pyrinomonadaceae bacterium]
MKTPAIIDVLRRVGLCVVLSLAIGLSVVAQTSVVTSKLKGTVYDAQGSVVVKAKVTAVNPSKKKFETFSDENGEYEIALPYNKYDSSRKFEEAVYDISVESPGFTTTVIKSYVFIPSQFGMMQLDLALRLEPLNDESHP